MHTQKEYPERHIAFQVLPQVESQLKASITHLKRVPKAKTCIPALCVTASFLMIDLGWGAKFGPEGSSIIGSPSGNPE